MFTQPPWSSDVIDQIYAVNGRPGLTTVATLQRGAKADVLAAAPDLLDALEYSMDCLEQEYFNPTKEGRSEFVRVAKVLADAAIAHARVGYPALTTRERLWTVNPALPPPERKANEHLLDAAPELLEAATKVYGALAGHVNNPEVVGQLRHAIARTM